MSLFSKKLSILGQQIRYQSKRFLLVPHSANSRPLPISKLRELLSDMFKPHKTADNVKPVLSQKELPPRRMIDSYREATIALHSDKTMTDNKTLRDQYVNFYNNVRLGKLLEDLDSMAVWISYAHNMTHGQQTCPLVIVTALVDKIDLQAGLLSVDKDILLRGHVTWTGESSMEITMHVEQIINGAHAEIMKAQFLMVARDSLTSGKAFVNPLVCETAEEVAIFNEGKGAKKLREQVANVSLLKTSPTEEETKLVHQLFLDTIDAKEVTFKHRTLPPHSVWMSATQLKNIIICFPQERNLHNKMFGGYLMRQAFELAWANACLFCKARPLAVAMDDIMFRQSVEIGSLLFLSSQVCYTEGKHVQIRVHAEVVNPKTGAHATTNTFHFTFISTSSEPPSMVMPKSYAEYMMYIAGKRHFNANNKRFSIS